MHIPGISPHDISPNVGSETIIKEIDYSQFIVLIAFHGTTFPEAQGLTEKGIEVTRIVQNGNTIYIQARFQMVPPTATIVPGIVFPYHVVKIVKETLTQSGEITFILLDQTGKERARATSKVSK